MKVLEVVGVDELAYLYRVQKARSYEFVIYWNKVIPFVKRKFNNNDHCKDIPSVGCTNTVKNNQHIFDLNPKLLVKFNRMADAKKKYEHVGGSYLGR